LEIRNPNPLENALPVTGVSISFTMQGPPGYSKFFWKAELWQLVFPDPWLKRQKIGGILGAVLGFSGTSL
jgi:hypothetical protein